MGRRLILDTNASSPMNARTSTAPHSTRTNSLSPLHQSPSTASVYELADTAERAADRARALAAITSVVDVLDYTESTAVQHARLIAYVRQTGTPRGAHDLLIAAHAAQTGRTILSYDAKPRFADLPGILADLPGILAVEP